MRLHRPRLSLHLSKTTLLEISCHGSYFLYFCILLDASDLVVSSGPGICPTPGCKGIGHIKGPKFNGHHRYCSHMSR